MATYFSYFPNVYVGEGINDDRPIVRVDENTVEYQFPQESTVPIGNLTLFEDDK